MIACFPAVNTNRSVKLLRFMPGTETEDIKRKKSHRDLEGNNDFFLYSFPLSLAAKLTEYETGLVPDPADASETDLGSCIF